MKKIYLARDFSQAHLLVDVMAQHMIRARVENVHQASGLGELAVSFPEIWVERDADEMRALEVIKTFESSAREAGVDVVCPQCQEANPASFDLCWSCEAELIDA